jgi:carbonic anhydrase
MTEEAALDSLQAVAAPEDIPEELRETPVGRLLEYHDLERPFENHDRAELLIGMCMDNRNQLHIPNQFAFILRAGGANLRASEFKISFAVAIGGLRHMALIGHTQCGMVGLHNRRDQFIDGLVRHAGWTREAAAAHFDAHAPLFEIGNEEEFIRQEAKRLNARYPLVRVVPMIYRVEDHRLYLLKG